MDEKDSVVFCPYFTHYIVLTWIITFVVLDIELNYFISSFMFSWLEQTISISWKSSILESTIKSVRSPLNSYLSEVSDLEWQIFFQRITRIIVGLHL